MGLAIGVNVFGLAILGVQCYSFELFWGDMAGVYKVLFDMSDAAGDL